MIACDLPPPQSKSWLSLYRISTSLTFRYVFDNINQPKPSNLAFDCNFYTRQPAQRSDLTLACNHKRSSICFDFLQIFTMLNKAVGYARGQILVNAPHFGLVPPYFTCYGDCAREQTFIIVIKLHYIYHVV